MRNSILLIMFPLTICGMQQQKIDWLIRPSNLYTNHYGIFYKRLFEEKLNKKLIKRMKDYARVRRFKEDTGEKAWIDNELEFQHELRGGSYARAHDDFDEIRIASFILSGVEKDNDTYSNGKTVHQTCWIDESPLHIAIRQQKKIVIAALLMQTTNTTLAIIESKTPLQMVKRMALKNTKYSDLEICLKRHIWHKHVLLHKRIAQRSVGYPFNALPREIVSIIAEKAYGPYK